MKKILTDEFVATLKPVELAFPKPIPKKPKTMVDYANERRYKGWGEFNVTSLKKGRKHKKRLPSISSLKKKADLTFSVWIRNRDKNTCVLCGKKEMIQCGHLIKRGKMATRYDKRNCNALCSGCNYRDNFEPQHYVVWFINKWGASTYKFLVEESKHICQMKRQDFLDLIKQYAGKTTTNAEK